MNSNKKDYKGIIKLIEKISKDTYKMQIESDLQGAKSGQFISIYCPNKTMRRPFSIADFDCENKITTVLFKLKGDGTKFLSELKNGDEIKFLAPLGNGFEIQNKNSLLVGAGIGIAPMLFLKKELNKKNIKNYLISGFKENDEVIAGSDENVIGGSVLDNLEKLIKEKNIEVIYSCGPTIVLKKLSILASSLNIPVFVAMEKTMACSIGVCRGCVIRLMKDNEITYYSVCKDGPVFKGSEIVWD